ncbi:MAG: hypothetical protein F6J96_32115 [Symploca sp. SIO1C2]|nr:hypothetical protein [Symploca sp. SIO1C2]
MPQPNVLDCVVTRSRVNTIQGRGDERVFEAYSRSKESLINTKSCRDAPTALRASFGRRVSTMLMYLS